MKRKSACWYILLALTAATSAPAADSPGLTARRQNKARAGEFDAANKALAVDSNVWIRPGLIADRSRRRVRIAAETIRLDLNKPVEFPLISENSGKDYEALAVSFASPSDVHAALEFIGLKPGKGVDAAGARFWPKGERVRVLFEYEVRSGGSNKLQAVSASQLILDDRTGRTLPEDGFVFTGSEWVPPPASGGGTNRIYAADVFSPNCIVSVYNERTTVLDVPRRAAQHEVYTHLIPNPDMQLPDAGFVVVSMQPLDPPGHQRVMDIGLRVGSREDTGPETAAALPWTLAAPDIRETGNSMPEMTNVLARWIASARDPHVVIEPADTMTVADLRRLAGWLEKLEDQGWMRIDPPLAGHPYYKTFLPDERHRQRAGRPVQPWEVYVSQAGAGVTGQLVYVEEVWQEDDTTSSFGETRYPVGSAEDIPEALARHKDAPAVVLIFAESTLSYGTLRAFMAPFLKRNMIVYVFEDPRKP